MIDFTLFKRISWKSGMPMIIVDLISYMTGGVKDPSIKELCL